ncbi:NVEALA domain-containing protein [Tannerella forsythia]|uniref:NVEALA domain-containing protein n=1 Tax=Tannerella forsythia TaxID=28112 RepID=UPI00293473E6|nr:NVEALA domain-containing protein [Tannerella forsythia]
MIKNKNIKTKILGGIFALAVMVATGYGVNRNMENNANLSEMALKNVEALARFEGDGGDTGSPGQFCYDTITTKRGMKTFFCGSCSYVEDSKPSFWAGESKCWN